MWTERVNGKLGGGGGGERERCTNISEKERGTHTHTHTLFVLKPIPPIQDKHFAKHNTAMQQTARNRRVTCCNHVLQSARAKHRQLISYCILCLSVEHTHTHTLSLSHTHTHLKSQRGGGGGEGGGGAVSLCRFSPLLHTATGQVKRFRTHDTI